MIYRLGPQDLKKLLQPLVMNLLNESITTPAYMVQLLEDLPPTDSSLKLWTVLVQFASESDLCVTVLETILIWPFKMTQVFTDVS